MLITGQLKKFLIIGVITVAIDYSAYGILVYFLFNLSFAKTIGFVLGTFFSFIANRKITFGYHEHFWRGLAKFIFLYAISMTLNVFFNNLSLKLLGNISFKFQISFIIATIISATINFLGMKFFVFKKPL